MSTDPRINARPILKWAGGKSSLLTQYEPYLPTSTRHYYEPFAGSAALFFHMRNEGRAEGYHLSDLNEELIRLYIVLRDQPDTLIGMLAEHRDQHTAHQKAYYNRIRALDRKDGFHELDDVTRAARMVYLNRTCYNGLWRVNSKGQFNVPMGRYKNPAILDEERLKAASEALQGVDLRVCPFADAVLDAGPGDFVYFDPPYVPVSPTANFTDYYADGFGEAHQHQLAEVARWLADRGVYVMVSNSDAPLVHDLYDGFRIRTVQAQRRINRDAGKRGHINELLISA